MLSFDLPRLLHESLGRELRKWGDYFFRLPSSLREYYVFTLSLSGCESCVASKLMLFSQSGLLL
jgi:hypothetical protein